MRIKLPQHFDVKINLKRALYNGLGIVLFLSLATVTNEFILGAGFLFGCVGGSLNDIFGWLGNKEAIIAYKSMKEEDSE